MISMISNELILLIGGYCSINDIYNLSLVSKVIANLKLYRLCMSHIVCYRFIGEYSYINFKKEIDYFKPYYSINYQYNLNNYLCDLFETLFNINDFNINSRRCYYRKYKFSLKYKNSLNILNILKDRYKLTKSSINNDNDNDKIRDYPRCHHVYRVCPVVYTHLKKHPNVLALIY